MKKVLFTLSLLVFSLVGYAQSFADANVVSVENFNIKVGKTATVEILLDNTCTDIVGWEFEIEVPEGFSVIDAQPTNARTYRYSVNLMSMGGTRYYVGAFHADLTPINGTSGAFMTLTLQAPATATVGETYNVKIEKILLSSNSEGKKYVNDAPFTFTVVADKLDLWDTATEAPAATTGVENVNLHRSFTANTWQTLVVPFDMNETQIEEAFGAGTIVGEFDDWNYNAGELTINFTANTSIAANMPVILKPTVGTTQEEGVMISNVAPFTPMSGEDLSYGKNHGSNKNPKWGLFYGTYEPITITPDKDEEICQLYLKNGRFYYVPEGGVTMKPYRAYLDLYDVLEIAFPSSVKMTFDEDLTAINGIDEDRTNGKVYTIDGKYVGKDVNFNRMQKGVYIVNGKKVIK